MSELSEKVKNCGLHDCSSKCFAISEREAREAIEVVKRACVEAVMKLPARGDMRRMAIQAINNVE